MDILAYANMLGQKTKIVGIINVSNVLGAINLVVEVYAMARTTGAVSLVDGAQLLPHCKVDVQSLGCDFFTFSWHKFLNPPVLALLMDKVTYLIACLRGKGAETWSKMSLSQKQLMPDYQLNLKQERGALLMQLVSAQRLTI